MEPGKQKVQIGANMSQETNNLGTGAFCEVQDREHEAREPEWRTHGTTGTGTVGVSFSGGEGAADETILCEGSGVDLKVTGGREVRMMGPACWPGCLYRYCRPLGLCKSRSGKKDYKSGPVRGQLGRWAGGERGGKRDMTRWRIPQKSARLYTWVEKPFCSRFAKHICWVDVFASDTDKGDIYNSWMNHSISWDVLCFIYHILKLDVTKKSTKEKKKEVMLWKW